MANTTVSFIDLRQVSKVFAVYFIGASVFL